MKKEEKNLLITGFICALGCLFIAIYNSAQAAFLNADVIPSSEYKAAVSVSDSMSSMQEKSDDGSSSAAAQTTVNINTASAEELCEVLPGIGEVKAKSIIEYREAAGGFDSVDELLNVKGIGEKTLEKIRPYCRLKD
ncbi:MAG: helix-hairpin-helix domain-containing protein [Firmicutes bacterium]|nr:helix-hairpin-helix domain-containing protein [Bacillota bacterium]